MTTAFWADVGWLIVLVVTVAVPLALDAAGRLSYFTSLTLWAIPIAYLGPLFRSVTQAGAERRRRALAWTIALIVALGIVLDFLLGHLILRFEACATAPASLRCLPAVGGRVPFEEVLFYAMAPAAMVLAYACADERW